MVAQVAGFSGIRLDISDFPTRHPYGLALLQNRFEEILAAFDVLEPQPAAGAGRRAAAP